MIFSSSVSLNRIAEDFFIPVRPVKKLYYQERMSKNEQQLLSERNRNHAL